MNVESQEGKEEVKEEIVPKKIVSGTKKIIDLTYPIPVPKEGGGDVMVSQIEVGRVKVKHLKALPKGFMDKKGSISPSDMVAFISGLTGLPIKSIEEIDVKDLTHITSELESFLAG